MLTINFPNPRQIFSVQSKSKRDGINSSTTRHCLAGASRKCRAAGSDEKKEEEGDLRPKPKHIAIIADGNRRWATNKGLSVQHGHRAAGKATKQLALNCMKYGAKVLSIFSLSTENWIRRPKEDTDNDMSILEEIIASDIHELITKHDMRVNFLGNRTQLPLHVQYAIQFAEESSKGNNGMHLMIAANYGGRYDIVEANKKIAAKVKHGILEVEDIDDNLIEQQLETNVIDDFPNPDLLIRTSGEMRISNYMLWQLAYTELFFCNKMFPEFGEEDLLEVMTAFEKRQRRYGGSFVTTKNII